MPKYILLLILSIPTLLFGQTQDCGSAEPICSGFFTRSSPTPGVGLVNDLANYTGCLDNKENNSEWYFFTIQDDGRLLFDIVPPVPADYDFALFRLIDTSGNSYNCADIASGALSEVRCNFSGTSQDTTGLRDPFTNHTSGPSGPPFSAPLNVFTGEVYVLLVDKFSSGQAGYDIDFSPSTASIVDVTPPEIIDVVGVDECEPVENIELIFSEPVVCDQIISSNFTINGPQPVNVINVVTDCDASTEYVSSVVLILDQTIIDGGSYTIVPQNLQDNCGNVIDPVAGSFDIVVSEIPVAIDSFEVVPSCLADTFFFFDLSEGDISAVHWDFGDNTTSTDNNPIHIYDSLGDYTVTLTAISVDSCISQTSRTVTVINSFQANFTVNNGEAICEGQLVQFTDKTRGGANSWFWDFDDAGSTSDLQNPTYTYTAPGTYGVMLVARDTTTLSCAPDTAIIDVVVHPNINANFAVEDTACQSEFIYFDSIPNASSIEEYSWDFGNNSTSTSPNPEFFYPEPGSFIIELIVIDQYCGSDTASSSIFVKRSPQFSLGNDTAICVSDEYLLRVDDEDIDGIRWSDGSTRNTLLLREFPAQISVEVLKNGCTTTDQVFVAAKRDGCYIVNIPSAFTPNDDGLNDLLKVLPTRILDFELRIYNRWGELLYVNEGNFNQGWDGAYNGQPQDVGVYTYFIKATGMDGRTIRQSGNITLLR
ncbi:MAG: PKD domain-containing protein [Chitinophagales bacterium]